MPKWNVRDDWPSEFKPVNKEAGLPDVLFAMPFYPSTPIWAFHKISLEMGNDGAKRLVIDIQQQTDVLAMVSGQAQADSNKKEVLLTSDIFSLTGVNTLFAEKLQKSQQSVGIFPVSWFKSWIEAGRIPKTIVYEGIEPKFSGNKQVRAGSPIGTLSPGQTLKLSIKYADGRFMHPREFFSLLFWEEKCDPIFKENPEDYSHPLTRFMLSVDEDGDGVVLNEMIDRNTDNWLALRPPLRTYQRVKWEAIKEHLRVDYSVCWPGETSNVSSRIKNPYLYAASYTGFTKCNIFAGEILFRAGFRTIVWGGGINCSTGSLPGWLKYDVPRWANGQDGLFNNFSNNPKSRPRGQIRYNPTSSTQCNAGNATHELYTPFAYKVSCNIDSLNEQIENSGTCFVLVSHTHVCIIAQVNTCAPTTVKAIDQWTGDGAWNWSRNAYSHTYSKGSQEVVILRIIPGGDPTETWGAMDLNCLKEA